MAGCVCVGGEWRGSQAEKIRNATLHLLTSEAPGLEGLEGLRPPGRPGPSGQCMRKLPKSSGSNMGPIPTVWDRTITSDAEFHFQTPGGNDFAAEPRAGARGLGPDSNRDRTVTADAEFHFPSPGGHDFAADPDFGRGGKG